MLGGVGLFSSVSFQRLYVEHSSVRDGHHRTAQNDHPTYLSLDTLTTDESEANAPGCVRYTNLHVTDIQVLPYTVTVLETIRQKTNYKVATPITGTNLT